MCKSNRKLRVAIHGRYIPFHWISQLRVIPPRVFRIRNIRVDRFTPLKGTSCKSAKNNGFTNQDSFTILRVSFVENAGSTLKENNFVNFNK